jgi:predicted amidophosphoribosyltransferase
MSVANPCPVCQARFRGARICSRCGANLEPLMRLSARAWQWRQSARQAIETGEYERAHELATRAQGVQRTSSGEALQLLSRWLQE